MLFSWAGWLLWLYFNHSIHYRSLSHLIGFLCLTPWRVVFIRGMKKICVCVCVRLQCIVHIAIYRFACTCIEMRDLFTLTSHCESTSEKGCSGHNKKRMDVLEIQNVLWTNSRHKRNVTVKKRRWYSPF